MLGNHPRLEGGGPRGIGEHACLPNVKGSEHLPGLSGGVIVPQHTKKGHAAPQVPDVIGHVGRPSQAEPLPTSSELDLHNGDRGFR